jgi:hypothetical protein
MCMVETKIVGGSAFEVEGWNLFELSRVFSTQPWESEHVTSILKVRMVPYPRCAPRDLVTLTFDF